MQPDCCILFHHGHRVSDHYVNDSWQGGNEGRNNHPATNSGEIDKKPYLIPTSLLGNREFLLDQFVHGRNILVIPGGYSLDSAECCHFWNLGLSCDEALCPHSHAYSFVTCRTVFHTTLRAIQHTGVSPCNKWLVFSRWYEYCTSIAVIIWLSITRKRNAGSL